MFKVKAGVLLYFIDTPSTLNTNQNIFLNNKFGQSRLDPEKLYFSFVKNIVILIFLQY